MTEHPAVALVGPWVANKGDDLMLRAVTARIPPPIGAPREVWPAGIPPGLAPMMLPPERGAEIRALSDWRPATAIRLTVKRGLMSLAADRTATAFGCAPVSGVRLLLDCSGFAYGDAWSERRMIQRAAAYRWFRRKGARVVFLPQALGPFKTPAIRKAATDLFSLADILCARDRQSAEHAKTLMLPDTVRLMVYPDITHGLPKKEYPALAEWQTRVAIVPNMRMVDKTASDCAAAYRAFIQKAAEEVRRAGYEPFMLLHEENDRGLAAELNDSASQPMRVIDVDALRTRAILGACRAVVASRYHAIVSSLAQATPVIGTSWTHKYDELLSDYGQQDRLLRPEADADRLTEKLAEVLHEPARLTIVDTLTRIARSQAGAVEAMWTDVTSPARQSESKPGRRPELSEQRP